MPRILGMEPKMAMWVIGGAILLVVAGVLLRRRSPAPSPVAYSEGEGLPGGAAAGAAYAAQPDQQAGYAQQLEALLFEQQKKEIAFQGRQMDFQQAQFERGAQQWQKLAGKRGGFKCRSGKQHIDPETGQIYCREEESGGFFSDFVAPLAGQLAAGFVSGSPYSGSLTRPRGGPGGSYGTPPIVPWQQN